MRWLYHVRRAEEAANPTRYSPSSLGKEGFVHASFRDSVAESARLYFAPDDELEVIQVDPRRLDARVDLAATPRGPMPHVHGGIPRDAIRAVHPVDLFATNPAALPDAVTGTRFAFVAFQGMTLLDLVGVYDPLSRIRGMGFDETSSCEIVGAQEGTIWAADGAELTVRRARPPLEEFDVLVAPGGPGSRALVHDVALVVWLSSFPANRLVASVCTGALLLGAMGRLRGKRATTHASAMVELAAYGATAVSERVVDEGQVVTAGGVTSGIDLGLHLVQRLVGEEVRRKVAGQMEAR